MLDARYFAFATLSALLVISPGATLAVVVETALGEGRRAALLTVLGVGLANATLATAAAVGLSAVFAQWPSALHGFRLAGGTYLAYLGLRGLRHALARGGRRAKGENQAGGWRETGAAAAASAVPRDRARVLAHVVRGVLTNLLNPPVVLFYMTVVPQFIGPQDPFLARALLLGTTHVAMSVVWQGSCGLAVGFAAEHMARPAVRRTLEGLTGVALVALGARLLL
jgi:threonine/homoserine/homoserine lactone efflux protein